LTILSKAVFESCYVREVGRMRWSWSGL